MISSPSLRWLPVLFTAIVLLGVAAQVRSEDEAKDQPKDAAKDQTKNKDQPKDKVQNPAGEARWNVIGECQMVVLPQKAAWPLIPDLSDDDKIEAAWTKVQQMIERGEATLIANLTVRGETGVRLLAESTFEVRYATEYTPPQFPEQVPKEKAVEFLKNWPAVGITPTAFETRNVGETLELTATVSHDGQWISLEVVPQHVRFLRFVKIDAGILPSGARLSIEQPYFSELGNHLTMHLRAGQRVLLGMHKIPEDEKNMEFFFLRVRPQRTGNAP